MLKKVLQTATVHQNRDETEIVNIFLLGWTRRQIFKPPDIPQSLRRTWQLKDSFWQEYQQQIADV